MFCHTSIPEVTGIQDFGIINPTENKITVTARLRDVDGKVKATNRYVLNAYDMIASGIVSSGEGTSRWFLASNDNSCVWEPNINVDADEGYITITSETFTTFGPVGFCNNDYVTVDTDLLRYEYSIWSSEGVLLNDYRHLIPATPLSISAWTENVDRSTDVVVNLTSYKEGECQEAEYLISDRDGNYFKTFDTVEPGPSGYRNFPFCHKVNVVHFGGGIFNSKVGISAKNNIPFLQNNNFVVNAGWIQWNIESRTLSARSEF